MSITINLVPEHHLTLPIQIFSGGQHGKGYESLLLGKQIINITGGLGWWVADPMRLTLLQIYRCLEIVAHTSGWKPPKSSFGAATDAWSISTANRLVGDTLQHTDDVIATTTGSTSPSRIPGPGGQYTLDVSFGVARKTLQCLNKTIELASIREARQVLSQDWRWPEQTHSTLRQLESEIFEIFADANALAGEGASNLLAQEGISDYVNEEIKENHGGIPLWCGAVLSESALQWWAFGGCCPGRCRWDYRSLERAGACCEGAGSFGKY